MAPRPITPEEMRLLAAGKVEGDASRRAHMGIVSDFFDVLARPSRAGATGLKYHLDKDPSTSFGEGVKQGITGKAKFTYSDVLADQGITGAKGAVLGFLGDVLLDPLTYTSVGITKGVSKNLAEIRAMQTLSNQGAEAVARETSRILAQNPTKLQLKVFGKGRGPSLNIPGASGTGEKIVQRTVGTAGNRKSVLRKFSTNAELPFGLNNTQRVIEGGLSGRHADFQRMIKQMFEDTLTKQERIDIAMAIDQGHRLNVPLTLRNGERLSPNNPLNKKVVQHPEGFTHLEHYRVAAMRIMKDQFDDEVGFGIVSEKAYNPKFVSRVFRNPPAEMVPSPINRNPTVKSSSISLQEAIDKGYDPVTDIAELLGIRAEKHHRSIGRAMFVDRAVNDFGTVATGQNAALLKAKGWRNASEALKSSPIHDRWKNHYLPREVIQALELTEKVTRDATEGSKFMQSYDKMLGSWKYLNTVINPGYHIRNTMTDAMMNAADGVVDPRYYIQAGRVLKDRNEVSKALFHDPVGTTSDQAFRELGGRFVETSTGRRLTTKHIWQEYSTGGSKSSWMDTEISKSSNPTERSAMSRWINNAGQTIGLKGTQGKNFIGNMADNREDFFRLAHFLKAVDDEFKANPKATLHEAGEAASKRVRKYNIDYGNLTTFEKSAMRRAIPFYSFMRQNLPLQLGMLFTKPGFMALYPKGIDLTQGVLGTQDASGEYLVPDWIRESMPVRIATGKKAENKLEAVIRKFGGASEGEPVFIPSIGGVTPLGDLANVSQPFDVGVKEGPRQGIQQAFNTLINQATPAVRIPTELATGRSLFTGAEIENTPGGWGKWMASQISPSRQTYNIAQGDAARWNTISSMMGIPLRTATKERQRGEFRRREDPERDAIRKIKEGLPPYQEYVKAINQAPLTNKQKEAKIAAFLRKIGNEQTRTRERRLGVMDRYTET